VARGSIKLDLHRRDFTINTIALRLDGRYFGQLLDPWGGGRDLRQGLVRVLHSLSFVDDPTRMLRAVRLEQRLGFTIEARTLELLEQALPLLSRVSGERIRNELELIFSEDRFAAVFARLNGLGLLAAIHPALAWDGSLEAFFAEARSFEAPAAWRLQSRPDREHLLYALWVFRAAEAEARSLCERMHFSLEAREVILEANRLRREVADGLARQSPSNVVARLDDASEAALVAAWIGLSAHPQARAPLERYLSEWRFVEPTIDGQALRARGLRPGPAYRKILGALRVAWLDGKIHSAGEEQELLDALVAEVDGRG
jgi:tRNA nucleotidyltransferase (CCA-adding enzyme)